MVDSFGSGRWVGAGEGNGASIAGTWGKSKRTHANFLPSSNQARRSAFFFDCLVFQTRSQNLPAYAAFSTTRARWESAGQVDVELAAKLPARACVGDGSGRRRGPVMTRKFGDEKIRVSFSIADLQNLGAENDYDTALSDELEDVDSHAINEKGAKPGNIKVAPEDKVAPSDREEDLGLDEEAPEPGYPVHANVTIEKPGKGCMYAECLVEDGVTQILELQYFEKADIANAQSADKQWARGNIYAGPPFGNLDEDLQILVERYLEERGIDAALASFIPDYIDFKEQREYVRWLGNLKKFVEV
ncbi:SUAPRGA1 protein [Coccidioides immitis RMSCC 3703]|uniref:SUAPRGA1 protein n=1 Tax=Coccidioides immitis RMSCC 3703 TaxID=454286 RepID=A0A0J8QPF8_COCIT|nr:SUAPRGA1 protein [Coccidioides immitis RMSCC 3703]